jgi:hypothetical protein
MIADCIKLAEHTRGGFAGGVVVELLFLSHWRERLSTLSCCENGRWFGFGPYLRIRERWRGDRESGRSWPGLVFSDMVIIRSRSCAASQILGGLGLLFCFFFGKTLVKISVLFGPGSTFSAVIYEAKVQDCVVVWTWNWAPFTLLYMGWILAQKGRLQNLWPISPLHPQNFFIFLKSFCKFIQPFRNLSKININRRGSRR